MTHPYRQEILDHFSNNPNSPIKPYEKYDAGFYKDRSLWWISGGWFVITESVDVPQLGPSQTMAYMSDDYGRIVDEEPIAIVEGAGRHEDALKELGLNLVWEEE